MHLPSHRNAIAASWLLLSACVHQAKPLETTSRGEPGPGFSIPLGLAETASDDPRRIVVSVKSLHRSQTFIWFTYAKGLMRAFIEEQDESPLRARFPAHRAEWEARKAMAALMTNQDESKYEVAPYAESQAALLGANLLDEYILTHFSEPGWYLTGSEAASLALERYEDWAASNLPEHRPQKHAFLEKPDGRRVPDSAPGWWSPGPFERSEESCAEHSDTLLAATSRWKEESASFDVVLISPPNRKDYLSLLSAIVKSPKALEKGILWVDPKVAEFHFAASFCSFAAGRPDEALASLRTSIELAPDNEEAKHLLQRIEEMLAQRERARSNRSPLPRPTTPTRF